MTRLAVVMPAWNEAEGLPEFITELNNALSAWSPTFVIVDDCSSDDTANAARSLIQFGISIEVHTNARNLGHGPSTVNALNLGLALNTDYVIAVDGDGQFLGEDVCQIMKILEDSGADVVEGVRTNRDDPLYRRLVSLATRMLVATRARVLPSDANTPLRAYRTQALVSILSGLSDQPTTPNLTISALCRRWRLRIIEIPVRSISRRGSDPQGNTWGQTRKHLPNRRFVVFCVRAAREWVAIPVRRNSRTGSR